MSVREREGELDMTSCVPFQKAVTACVTCMAQPLIALTTKPGGEDTTMVNIAMKSTMSTRMSWPIVVSQSDRVMPEWKGADDRCSTSAYLRPGSCPKTSFVNISTILQHRNF